MANGYTSTSFSLRNHKLTTLPPQLGALHRPRSRRNLLHRRMGPCSQRRKPNRLALHTRPLRSRNVHHVGDNLPLAITPTYRAEPGRAASGVESGSLVGYARRGWCKGR